MTVIDTPAGIRWIQFCARRLLLRTEVRTGLKRSGGRYRSASVICKQAYCLPLTATRAQTLALVEAIYTRYTEPYRPHDFILEYPSDGAHVHPEGSTSADAITD